MCKHDANQKGPEAQSHHRTKLALLKFVPPAPPSGCSSYTSCKSLKLRTSRVTETLASEASSAFALHRARPHLALRRKPGQVSKLDIECRPSKFFNYRAYRAWPMPAPCLKQSCCLLAMFLQTSGDKAGGARPGMDLWI